MGGIDSIVKYPILSSRDIKKRKYETLVFPPNPLSFCQVEPKLQFSPGLSSIKEDGNIFEKSSHFLVNPEGKEFFIEPVSLTNSTA